MEVSCRVPSLQDFDSSSEELRKGRKKERKRGCNFRIRTIRLSRVVKVYVPLSSIFALRDSQRARKDEEEGVFP